VKAARLTYHRAETLGQAMELARRFNGAGKLMAGGQSLVPMMNLRMAAAEHVIDISGIAALRDCGYRKEEYFLGAGVTHALLEDGKVEDPTGGYLRHVAAGIAYRSIRNRGTVGGSLAHADPAADWPAALRALDALAVVAGEKGERQVPLADFQRGLMETALAEGEILTGVLVPKLSSRARWAYLKFTRKMGEFAHSIAAVVVDPTLGLSNVVLGAVGGKPFHLPRTSATLKTDSLSADLAAAELDPASYEFQVHKTMVTRALTQALGK
jgi:carbon-monoxide dehydrogenase medium subunit